MSLTSTSVNNSGCPGGVKNSIAMAKSTNTATPRKARPRSLPAPAHASAASTPRPLALRRAPQAAAGANGVAAIRPGSVADRTRNQLLHAASALIGEIGHVPSIGEVARAAGVSRATAYRRFGNAAASHPAGSTARLSLARPARLLPWQRRSTSERS